MKKVEDLKQSLGAGPWILMRFSRSEPTRLLEAAFRPPSQFADAVNRQDYDEGDWNGKSALKAFCIMFLLAAAESKMGKSPKYLLAKSGNETWVSSVVGAFDKPIRASQWREALFGAYPKTKRGEGGHVTDGLATSFQKKRARQGKSLEIYHDAKILPWRSICVFSSDSGAGLKDDQRVLDASALRGLAADIESQVAGWERLLQNNVPSPKTGEGGTSSLRAPQGGHRPNNIPFPKNRFLRGRSAELAALREALLTRGRAAISQPLAILGEGGIGKTQLAVQYAHSHAKEYKALFWVAADSPQSLRAGLAALAAAPVLDLKLPESWKEARVVDTVLATLQELSGWLLILDNADSKTAAQAVQSLILPLSAGHVISTSRRSVWPATWGNLTLWVLTKQAATEFLLERGARTTNEVAVAAEVAWLLGYFPLALEQAAAWVCRRQASWEQYLVRLRAYPKIALNDPGLGGTNYRQTVRTTWLLNYNELAPLGKHVLHLASYFGADPLSVDVLKHAFQRWNKTKEGSFSPEDFAQSIEDLCLFHLVKCIDGDVTVHRLIQQVTRLKIKSRSLREEYLSGAIEAILEACPRNPADSRDRPKWEKILMHATTVLDHASAMGLVSASSLKLAGEVGIYLERRVSGDSAIQLLGKADAQASAHFPGSLIESKASNDYGGVLWSFALEQREAGRESEAERYLHMAESRLRQSLRIEEQRTPIDPAVLAQRLSNLGNVVRDLNRLSEARELFERSLAHEIAQNGPADPRVAIRLNNLALVLQRQGHLVKAREYFESAFDITVEALGPDNAVMVIRHYNLGKVLQDLNELDASEKHLRRAVEIADSSLPETNANRRKAQKALAAFLAARC